MQEENREGISGALKTLAAVVIVFLLLAALYVGYQAMQVLFPPNTYETALLATVEDTVDAEGVLLFEESYVAGGGTLVPITGFANAVASPAIDSKSEGFVLGVGAKIFAVAGPVLLYGTAAGALYGLIYWICTLFVH